MQFHGNGFRAGDPHVLDAAAHLRPHHPEQLPETADVLIVGCGPAGLTLAAQLSRFPEIKVVIVDQKPGPLQVGQADGIACRTMEMFEAFGFAERVLKESYWVNETTFWKPSEADRSQISRSGRVPDVEEGLSHMPHVILNQARVHDFYLDEMARSAAKLVPHYGRKFISLERQDTGSDAYTVTARFEIQGADHASRIETIRAKYVVGCDGARSNVRQAIGRSLQGDSANQAWGVMDVLAVTDFPDIRFKALIQSAKEGSIVLIPREGGYMVRIYVELDKLSANERVAAKNISVEQLIAAAQRILHPYTLDVKEVAWWSVYEIGQRLCDKFDDVPAERIDSMLPRVFIAGDACHTHSPKAGQGMNVSMQDGFNLGWKLAAVLRGLCPESLLHTYSAERQAIAKQLIEFDREWAKMLSAPLRKPGDAPGIGVEPAQVQNYFVQHGRYTAGTATRYSPALLTGAGEYQHLATGFQIGTRFHSAPVMRIGDGKQIQLGSTLLADGRWRILAFAGAQDRAQAGSPIASLMQWLGGASDSPIQRFTRSGADIDSLMDVRAVFQQSHHDLPITAMPSMLFPPKGKLGLRDYEKAFCALVGSQQDIYAMRGVDRAQGCMVLVRPDQYIADVLPLANTHELSAFFAKLFSGSAKR
jgi:2-polyprenyl-6-methoxyphenol hydroxylase-like FAD-dependent oxidoreductase